MTTRELVFAGLSSMTIAVLLAWAVLGLIAQ